ncbi:MAG: rhodanese-like domain-containing protein [Bacteriovoracaceae bacterium]
MEIDITKIEKWVKEKREFTFLDVRRDDEREIASLGGVHIPLDQLQERFRELDPNTRPWVIYCHHGVRSLYAAQFLKLNGYDALSMRGGIDEWSRTIDPSVPRY